MDVRICRRSGCANVRSCRSPHLGASRTWLDDSVGAQELDQQLERDDRRAEAKELLAVLEPLVAAVERRRDVFDAVEASSDEEDAILRVQRLLYVNAVHAR